MHSDVITHIERVEQTCTSRMLHTHVQGYNSNYSVPWADIMASCSVIASNGGTTIIAWPAASFS